MVFNDEDMIIECEEQGNGYYKSVGNDGLYIFSHQDTAFLPLYIYYITITVIVNKKKKGKAPKGEYLPLL